MPRASSENNQGLWALHSPPLGCLSVCLTSSSILSLFLKRAWKSGKGTRSEAAGCGHRQRPHKCPACSALTKLSSSGRLRSGSPSVTQVLWQTMRQGLTDFMFEMYTLCARSTSVRQLHDGQKRSWGPYSSNYRWL